MSHDQDMRPLFERWGERIETLMREHPLQIISWEATRRCNLRCLHCGSPTEDVDNADEDTQLMGLAAGYGQARTALPGSVIDMSTYYIDVDNADEGAVVEYWTN